MFFFLFLTAGHSSSWKGQPQLLTECYDSSGKLMEGKGPMNPTRNETFEVLGRLFTELSQVFPDAHLHVGGDEVLFDCWKVRKLTVGRYGISLLCSEACCRGTNIHTPP
jgi:N-acetyl-beta-hexosaminidase